MRVSINKQIDNTTRVWLFDSICVSNTIRVYMYIMHELSHIGKVTVLSIWFRMMMTQQDIIQIHNNVMWD